MKTNRNQEFEYKNNKKWIEKFDNISNSSEDKIFMLYQTKFQKTMRMKI